MTVNILIGLLLSVAGFAAGWGISTLRQRYITKERELARVNALPIEELFRCVLNITEATRDCTDLGAKPSSGVTVSQNPNWLKRYEPS